MSMHAPAVTYRAAGYRVVRVKFRGKRPNVGDDWVRYHPNDEQLARDFASQCNIGIILGSSSRALDIDLDSKEAVEFADGFLPPTSAVFGRASNRGSHRLYRYAGGEARTEKFIDPILAKDRETERKTVIVELRADGCQTVVPPSVHESGEVITWETSGQPASVDYTELLAALKLLAVRVLVDRYGSEPLDNGQEAMLIALASAPPEILESAHKWLGIEPKRPHSGNGAAEWPASAPQDRALRPSARAWRPQRSRFIFDGAAETARPQMLVRDTVPKDGICFIAGQSGAGKTFIAIELAICLAEELSFFGRKVRERIGSAFVLAEGGGAAIV
jgi:hypothetical protein